MNHLKYFRKLQNMSRDHLGVLCGPPLPPERIAEIESGRRDPTPMEKAIFSVVLDVPVERLFPKEGLGACKGEVPPEPPMREPVEHPEAARRWEPSEPPTDCLPLKLGVFKSGRNRKETPKPVVVRRPYKQ
jgi:hypothetical protein